MEKKQKILESRERLDWTLASPNLTNEESLRSLVQKQLLRSPFLGSDGDLEHIVQKHTVEVSNFLDMLRSASGDEKDPFQSRGASHNDWKLKQETDRFRVMYREGLQGSPFHTLLAEGYVDGPMDCCLCVSWESTLYQKWWPQYNIPTFKITSSSSLQKVRIGEEISLVRVKVPWPVSDREALLHNFELEYFDEELILVLLTTIPHTEKIDMSTHGFTNDGIPPAKDTIRIDLVGGYALQKVSPTRSYFRTIANMDIKLEFVPPSLINFISRQLVGNGYKLYQKAVASLVMGHEDYEQALKGPMYCRIRDSLYTSKPKLDVANVETKESIEENRAETVQVKNNFLSNALTKEIEEEPDEHSQHSSINQHLIDSSTFSAKEHGNFDIEKDKISPEVQKALCILDKAITFFRDTQSPLREFKFSVDEEELDTADVSKNVVCVSEQGFPTKVEAAGISFDAGRSLIMENMRYNERGCESILKKPNNPKQESLPVNNVGGEETRYTSFDAPIPNASPAAAQPSVLDRVSKVFDEVSVNANSTRHSSYSNGIGNMKQKKKKQHRALCCLSVPHATR